MNRMMHYVTSIGFLVALFFVYQNTFIRWLEPEATASIPPKPAEQLQLDHSVEDLFAEGTWQRGACKCLQTAEGMLLFERREQTASNKWRLWPITVIMGRGMADNEAEPVILDADQGAEIELTHSLNVVGGAPPSIRRGRLIGPVRIYREPAQGSRSQPFELKTSNVGIDTRKIWTTDAIEMRFGEARILGRDLTIHLAGDLTTRGSDAASALDRMELIYLDDFNLPITKRANDGTVTRSQMTLRCGGRVEYDFALHLLMLRDSVSLTHQQDGGFVDRFDCQTLHLGLNDPADRSILREGPIDWIRQLVAAGNPTIASLPTYNAEVIADRITLDVPKGTLNAEGQKGIRLRRGGVSASLANLFYQFDRRAPEMLGTLLVDGAGIVTADIPELALRQAQWQTGLELRPTAQATLDTLATDVEVAVQGDVRAWLVDGGEFQADDIIGRLKSVEAPNPGQDFSSTKQGSNSKRMFVPDSFDITGNVRIATTAIIAQTETLKLFFEDDPDPSSGYPEDEERQSVNPPPLGQWVSQPDSPPGEGPSQAPPVAKPKPEIYGDRIVAKLRRHSAGLNAKGLKVAGNVTVKHTIQTGNHALATTLSGELLQLVRSGGEDVLQLGSGVESPARFDIGDGYFIGPEIQIRPSENLIWIKDAGEFRIPTDALPASLAGANGQGSENQFVWTKPPHCRWQGEMQFDGRVAVLTDGVDIDAAIVNGREPWEFKMSGEQLEVKLWEDVELTNMQTMQMAKVQSIELLESPNRPVLLEAKQWAPDGAMQSRHVVYTKKLVMTPENHGPANSFLPGRSPHSASGLRRNPIAQNNTDRQTSSLAGVIAGQGPGWYRAWVPSNDNEINTANSDIATMIDDVARPLTGLHLTFNAAMTANLSQKSLDFSEGVRLGLRPVTHWEETFNASEMNSLAIGESTLDCDLLRITTDPAASMAGRNSRLLGDDFPWEMQALRGVVFRTRSEKGAIQATAARASYASSKDLFTIQGAPNRPAVIRQTRPDGKPGVDASVRSAIIRPKTLTIDAEIIGVNIAAPAALQERR